MDCAEIRFLKWRYEVLFIVLPEVSMFRQVVRVRNILIMKLLLKLSPGVFFTLNSALRIHDLTDENPMRMTMAISSNSHAPKTTLPVDFVYMKKELLSEDVEEFTPNGIMFRVFSVERTIVECFKARKRMGINICVASLDEAMAKRRIDRKRLWDVMSRCRMTRIMSPYLEGRV